MAAAEDEVLARGEGLGSVSVCACGTVSLHVQALSLRMDVKAFAQATLMMNEAMAVLEAKARMRDEHAGVAAGTVLH